MSQPERGGWTSTPTRSDSSRPGAGLQEVPWEDWTGTRTDVADWSPLGLGVELLAVGLFIALLHAGIRRVGPGLVLARQLQGLLWGAYGFFVALRWSQVQPASLWIFGGLGVLAGIPVAWTLGRDLTWGWWVRNRVPEGSQLRVGSVEGRVRALGWRGLEMELDGWVRHVPYRALFGDFSVRASTKRSTFAVQFDLDIPDEGIELGAARQRLRELILCSPWAALHAEPRVEVMEGADGTPRFRIQAAAVVPEGVSPLHSDIRSAWRDLVDRGSVVASDRPAR